MTRKVTAFVLALLLVVLQVPLFAADGPEGQICGRVFKADMKTPYEKGEVRVVNTETGQSKNSSVKKGGCYSVNDLPAGSYSVSYFNGTAEYLLGEKILVKEKTTSVTCIATEGDNSLSMVAKCNCCKGIPLFPVFLLGGGAAAAAGAAVAIGGGEDPVASPSTPQ